MERQSNSLIEPQQQDVTTSVMEMGEEERGRRERKEDRAEVSEGKGNGRRQEKPARGERGQV